MANFSDKQLLALIDGTLDSSTQQAITEALELDEQLQQRLEQLAGFEQIASSITNYQNTPNIETEDTIPTQLGEFRILKQLGQGGMGTVYLAEDQKLKRHVAIKLISPAFRYASNFQEQFASEAKLAAQLDHPNIVPIFLCAEQDNQPYIVMKFIEGQNLAERLKQSPSLGSEEVCQIIQQICHTIDYAHQQNLIHCDIKPSNILLDLNNNAYLSDFGISRLLQQKTEISGTPAYQAPELCDQSHNRATDLYALGKVIDELSEHYNSPSIQTLIKSLCADNPKDRQLKDYTKIKPHRSNLKVWSFGFLSLLVIAALCFAFIPRSPEQPPESETVQSIPLSTTLANANHQKIIHLQGHYHLDDKIQLDHPLTFKANGDVTITTNSQEGKAFHIFADIQFEGITFQDLGRSSKTSLFKILSQHTLTLTNCKLIAPPSKLAHQVGFPMLALSQGSTLELHDCQIECLGSIAIGSYPRAKDHSDRIRLTNTKIDAEVCFFRARSAGNTLIEAKKSHFHGKYLLSQNARSGDFHIHLDHCKVLGDLLFLPHSYPVLPSKTLRLKATASQLPITDLPWLETQP